MEANTPPEGCGEPRGDGEAHSTACHRVLNTIELLEQILIRAPIKDVLLAQRVCTTWKNCIDNSTSLQKVLFFKPAADFDSRLSASRYSALGRDREAFWYENARRNLLLAREFEWRRPGQLPRPSFKRLFWNYKTLRVYERPEASWRLNAPSTTAVSERLEAYVQRPVIPIVDLASQ